MTDTLITGTPVAGLVTVAAIALLMAGAVAAIEVALSYLSRATAQDLVDEGARRADLVHELLSQRSRTLLVLRGVRTAWQVIGAVSVTIALAGLPLPWWAVGLIAVVTVGTLQFLTVSVVAVRVGRRNPEKVAQWGAQMTMRAVRISRLFDPAVDSVREKLPQSAQTEAEARAEVAEDLREMVDQVGETEGLEDEDREMLLSVFELGHTLVREIMVPRTDMVTIEAEMNAREALRVFVRSGFSRVPVIGESADDMRGILYFKDVVHRLETYGVDTDLTAEQMMRPAEYTIEMKAADDLLRIMQAEHFHMALVVDEYGGISGLVTMEDLIEELVGEVTDEHDRNVIEPEELADGVWRVPSRFSIDDLGDLLGMELEDDDVDSVGGLLAKAIGQVPLPGAEGELLGVHMMAEEARGRRRQVGTIVCSRIDQGAAEGEPDQEQETGDALSK